MLVDRILRLTLTMRSVKREILDRKLHAVCDLPKIDPICNYYPICYLKNVKKISVREAFNLIFKPHGLRGKLSENVLAFLEDTDLLLI